MMDMHIQAELHDKRGEHDLAALLREMVVEEFVRLKEIDAARLRAVNVILNDEDY